MSIVRYRFRAYPTPGQEQALARTFGCARVVYNDCLRLRQDAHAAGEKLSDTDVQRRVVTEAKQTAERAWLGEVASVALVQACQDARRAYRNWFDSLSGKRKGRRIGHTPESYPYPTALVGSLYDWHAKTHDPIAVVIVSQKTRAMLVASVRTRDRWRIESHGDRQRGITIKSYAVPRELLHPVLTLTNYLR